jgi:Rrf2 family transcriptional regulator, nitric oxide-sensitive transcriptional repressor
MYKINRKTEYALMALRQISTSQHTSLITAKEVSETLKTPFDATARVMQIMASNGLLKSEQGLNGGYVISQDLKSVSLLALIEMIEGKQSLVKCIQSQDEACEIHGSCNISQPLSVLDRKLNQFYQSIPLSEVIYA